MWARSSRVGDLDEDGLPEIVSSSPSLDRPLRPARGAHADRQWPAARTAAHPGAERHRRAGDLSPATGTRWRHWRSRPATGSGSSGEAPGASQLFDCRVQRGRRQCARAHAPRPARSACVCPCISAASIRTRSMIRCPRCSRLPSPIRYLVSTRAASPTRRSPASYRSEPAPACG